MKPALATAIYTLLTNSSSVIVAHDSLGSLARQSLNTEVRPIEWANRMRRAQASGILRSDCQLSEKENGWNGSLVSNLFSPKPLRQVNLFRQRVDPSTITASSTTRRESPSSLRLPRDYGLPLMIFASHWPPHEVSVHGQNLFL